MLEASEREKDGEILTKIDFFHFLYSYAMETAYWAYLFAVMASP